MSVAFIDTVACFATKFRPISVQQKEPCRDLVGLDIFRASRTELMTNLLDNPDSGFKRPNYTRHSFASDLLPLVHRMAVIDKINEMESVKRRFSKYLPFQKGIYIPDDLVDDISRSFAFDEHLPR